MDLKFPDVHVELFGKDGNSFSILGRVRKAMKRYGLSEDQIKEFVKEATSGDYDHLLQTVMKWVAVD